MYIFCFVAVNVVDNLPKNHACLHTKTKIICSKYDFIHIQADPKVRIRSHNMCVSKNKSEFLAINSFKLCKFTLF